MLLNCISIIQIYQVVNLLAIRLTWNPNIRAPQGGVGIKDITFPQCPNLIRSPYRNSQYSSFLILIKPTLARRIVHKTIFRSVQRRSPAALKVPDSSHAHTEKDFPPIIQLVYLVPNTKHYMTGPKSRFVIPPPECHPFIIKLFEVYDALVVILKFQDFSFIFLLPNVKTTLNYIVELLKETFFVFRGEEKSMM